MLDGAKILRETWCNNTIVPLYDNEDSVCGIIYNNAPYYFQKNLQGDIIGIVDKNSTVVARYSYDAWGKCTVDFIDIERTCGIDIANINPFRYRGYYFDRETGLYYLQSRYYDPEVGRFINSDDAEIVIEASNVLDYNVFLYVQNSPIILSDSSGESWITDLWKKVKNASVSAWNWIVKTASKTRRFFSNTILKKWIVNGVWNTFCKNWVWQIFCKKWVYNTFFKKWVWQTFCKKWTWNIFCKKWVWQTFCKNWTWNIFCKKWVWETFCKDWIANKAWRWFNGKSWYQTLIRNIVVGGIGALIAAGLIAILPLTLPAVAATIVELVIGAIVSTIYECLLAG